MNPNKTSAHPTISSEAETRAASSNQVRFDSDSGNVPAVVVVLLQIHGCSEERRGAAEETDGSLILCSLRYTHTHSLLVSSLRTHSNSHILLFCYY